MSINNLNGKTVLVIGGSAGIGLEIARIAADEGARVHIASRGVTNLEGRLDSATYHACDAKSQQSLDRLFEAVGSVDHVAMTVHESAARLSTKIHDALIATHLENLYVQ